jgi:hypothetical protein
MKTTRSIIVVLFVLLTAQIASAYYCPSTGHWLSRDPLGESGFQAITQPGIPASLPGGRWIQRDSSAANGLGLNQCPSCKKRAAMKVKMAVNEPNLYGFVQNAPIEQVDPFGLWATLDASGTLGCKDHANALNNAWQAATAAIQKALDNNNIPSWSGQLFDCMAQSNTKIGVSCSKCNLVRDAMCGLNGNTANINPATGTIALCSSFFSSTSCQQAEILAVEISKLDCGVLAASGEEGQFADWLNAHLCNQ